jgi:hypothetical protein
MAAGTYRCGRLKGDEPGTTGDIEYPLTHR